MRHAKLQLDTKSDFELTFYIRRSRRSVTFEIRVDGLPPAKGAHQSPLSVGHKHVERGRLLLEGLANVLPAAFEPLRCAVSLELTLYSPVRCPPGDALNFLGGVADVLQRKDRRVAGYLGPLMQHALYHDDRQVRRVRFDQRAAPEFSYVVRVRAIGTQVLRLDFLPRRRNPAVARGRPIAKTAELCVAFANASEPQAYDSFLEWSVNNGAITKSAAHRIRLDAVRVQAAEIEVLTQANELRKAVRSILASKHVDQEALEVVTMARRRCAMHEALVITNGLLTPRCDPGAGDPALPLCAITRSLVGLFGSDLRARVRHCADERCGRLFIDLSQNHSRRWCDMSACGNRAKQKRHRSRMEQRNRAESSLP